MRTVIPSRRNGSPPGFTLIELLVVIAIIAILAGMIVGLSSISFSQRRMAAAQGELRKLEMAIESYKAALGAYPASAPPKRPGVQASDQAPQPAAAPARPSPLFYELTGSYLEQKNGRVIYRSRGGQDISREDCQRIFGIGGFQNTAKLPSKARNFVELEDRDYASIQIPANGGSVGASVLVSRVGWPASPLEGADRSALPLESYRPFPAPAPLRTLNPWQYRSGRHAEHNQASFDLWAFVPAGDTLYRIDNWSREPIALNQ